MEITDLETISPYRMLTMRPLYIGDTFIHCGPSSDRAAQSVRALLKKRKGIDLKLEQKKVIIVDPKTAEATVAVVIRVIGRKKERKKKKN